MNSEEKKKLKEKERKEFIVQQKFSTAIRYYLHNAWTEMRRRPCYFLLSFFSVAIVVMASAVSQSTIDRAPIIFLKQAEGPGGEIDISIVPNYYLLYSNSATPMRPFLNTTRVQEVLEEDGSQVTARQLFQIRGFINCKETTKEAAQANCDSKKSGLSYFIDTKKEESLELGREYPFEPLKKGEILIHKKFADTIGVNKGQNMFLEFMLLDYLSALRDQLCEIPENPPNFCQAMPVFSDQFESFAMQFKVKDFIDDSYGKLSNGVDKIYGFFEYQYINEIISDELSETYSDFGEAIKNLDPKEFAGELLYNFKDRLDIYLNSNYDNIQYEVSQKASVISKKLGVYPIDMEVPVLEELYGTRFGAMFLGVILNMIVFILFMLSLMLLYNLLLVSVETKNFELAVLRTLGLNKMGVVSLILVQALSFVIPALVIGFTLSILGLMLVSNALKGILEVEISVLPTFNAFVLALSVGTLIPLFASIFPIKKALEQTLSIALDINRSKSMAVKVEVDIEGKQFPWGRVAFAIISAMFGISIYYFLPLSLLSFNIGLLINIFFWILVGMLLGFIMLTLNIQYLVERFVVYTTLFFTGSAIRSLILKNLASHRIKNRRVAMMYSLSVSFIIFIWTFSIIQIKSSEFEAKQQHGTYLDVEISEGFAYSKTYLPVQPLENLIESKLKDVVEDYSWVTIGLDDFIGSREGFRDVEVSHVGKIYRMEPKIIGVSPNLFKTTFTDEFLNMGERYQPNIELDPIEELYTARGSQSMIITQRIADFFFTDAEDRKESLFLIMNNGTYSYNYEMRVSSVVVGAPVLQTASFDEQSIVVSLPTYMRLCEDALDGFEDIPMRKLLIKTKDQKEETVDRVFNAIQLELNNLAIDASIWDYRDYKQGIDDQQAVINAIFSILTVLVMILCFFSLISSMTANIIEQSKEIAVLRAVGIKKTQMIRLYVYEAYTLVFSSSLIGMAVGIVVGFTMGLQRALFTQLPIAFEFPTTIFISIIITSIVCALLSTYIPSRKIMNNQISQIIRITG